jgi:hypothetical protein
MNLATPPSLSLADFDITPERGFLPAEDPLEHLRGEPTLDLLSKELP